MNTSATKHILTALAAAALLAPAVATAEKPVKDKAPKAQSKGQSKGKAKGKSKPKAKTVVFKGTVVSSDATTLVVKVSGGNSRAKAFKGQDVTFTITGAKLNVADTNGDTKTDGTDIKAGDAVVVQTAKQAKDAAQPFTARKVNDQTNPKPEPAPAPAPAPAS